MPPRIAEYLATHDFDSACVVIDTDVVEHNYNTMSRALPVGQIFYAVKANPADAVIERLASLGACFDAASPNEIDLCLRYGVSPARISYGNTIKKQRDIQYAYGQGVRMFAFDSDAELEKLAESAPGAMVYCRLLMECEGAEWPLSRKFGCDPEMALRLLDKARTLGLDPHGVSFHVGSQQTDLNQWDFALSRVARLFEDAGRRGINLRMVNLGGGMPARYTSDVRPLEDYADAIMSAMVHHFGPALPEMNFEPGRSIVGDAGVIQAEVVLISRKSDDDDTRWVYLDIGKFSGLAETMDESIKYRFVTPHDDGVTGPVILAGPTCDSMDILYEKAPYELPLDLKIGDKIQILSTGAYTTTYSAVGFNGFAPLQSVCI
ncbi:MAG: type III PLP-dependent enzyme [Proteobacteria bacterium]|nr:type III PLP-dependent enzyme [Pseudomonadota bacterium]